MPPQRNTPGHADSGLQPERTDLAWGRTTLSLMVAAATFLRWIPHHGWFVGMLVAAATLISVGIEVNRKRRLHRSVHGINEEKINPDITSTATVSAAVVTLAAMGTYTVLFLPIR